MILHLGGDSFVKTRDILMILDYEEAVRNKDTGLFLAGIEKAALEGGAPRAIVVTQEQGRQKAYLSPISARTLLKRGNRGTDLFAHGCDRTIKKGNQ